MEKLAALSILVFTLVFSLTNSYSVAENVTSAHCIDEEMNALLKFRKSLSDPSNRLFPWDSSTNKDCCTWRGVGCDKHSGHVISLDLGWSSHYPTQVGAVLLDPSLLELKYLSYLDLSGCDFDQSPIPTFLGSMTRLQHLNLSNSGFNGAIPHHIGNLSSLRVLDLRSDYGTVVDDDLTWISRLPSLEYLDLSGVDLSRTKHVMKVLMLPSLVDLFLYGCALNNTQLAINLYDGSNVNSTTSLSKIQSLNLGGNSLVGQPPHFLNNMTSLEILLLPDNSIHQHADWISDVIQKNCDLKTLDLSDNKFYGEFPPNNLSFKNLSSSCMNHYLQELVLGDNHLSGHFPSTQFIENLKHLKYLDLTGNELSGPIPSPLGKLFALETLDLSVNKLSGPMPSSIGNLSALQTLDLSSNELSGPIPSSLGNLSALENLYLSGNKVSGSIPSSLGNLSALETLYLRDNKLSGPIPSSLGKLSALEELDLSYNELSGSIPSSLGNLRALREFYFTHNQLNGDLPISLGQLSNLEKLDMTYNSQLYGMLYDAHFWKLSKLEYLSISHTQLKVGVSSDWVPPFQLKLLDVGSCEIIDHAFPQWIQTQKNLTDLDLSNCSIMGTLPEWIQDMTNLTNLQLSQNSINGTIPYSICEMRNLYALDLSLNHLSGSLPRCWASLSVLRLSSNHLSGVIPITTGRACSLQVLNLNDNYFTGKLPSTLRNCTNLIILDAGENKFSGKLPTWIGTHLPILILLRLKNNHFSGTIPLEFCQLFRLQVIDLANNRLTGRFPQCFGNFSGMIRPETGFYITEFDTDLTSHGMKEWMKGYEMEYTTTSRFLVNMDLSSNNLVGTIPFELTNLTALVGLNLSHNHLNGVIPERIGDMKSLESLDLSSNNLFGAIPQSLSSLASLSYLNLSHNNLSGPIPTGNQLQTLYAEKGPSIYDDNPLLCGAPLPKKCDDKKGWKDESHAPTAEDGDKNDKIWLSASIIAGFATGLWGVIGVLVFKRNWRQAFFEFAELRLSKLVLCT